MRKVVLAMSMSFWFVLIFLDHLSTQDSITNEIKNTSNALGVNDAPGIY